jgi:hypothetical protein
MVFPSSLNDGGGGISFFAGRDFDLTRPWDTPRQSGQRERESKYKRLMMRLVVGQARPRLQCVVWKV